MQEKIYDMLVSGDDVTWQSLLYELVKKEEMDPWDINVSKLTKQYVNTIKQLKEHDFRVSGKVVLAAAILLKIKSNRLVGEDLLEFDRLLAGNEEDVDLFEDLDDFDVVDRGEGEKVSLIPRIPQPRKRKVSIYDLVDALEKALEVKQRRVLNSIPPLNVEAPKKSKDLTQVIREVYYSIKTFFMKGSGKKMLFSQLLPSGNKEDKIFTFIPLLHLDFQRKINVEQEVPFEDISITLHSKKEVEKELE